MDGEFDDTAQLALDLGIAEHVSRARATHRVMCVRPSPEVIAAFRSRVVVTPTCHFFTGAISGGTGYGRVTFHQLGRARTMSAHTFALLISGVTLVDGEVGEHRCDETICVRVDSEHVRVASQPENLAHAVAVGRHLGPRPGNVDPRGRVERARAIRGALRDGYDAERLAAAARWPNEPTTLALF